MVGFVALCLFLSFRANAQVPIISKVDPFIGTGGHGHTFPGPTLPFGMMQLSPDTRLTGWDGCSGYHYSDTLVYGFSHTHLSGTGVSDYGDILLMPFIGERHFHNGADGRPGYRSTFSKNNEQAEPAYYRTYLDDHRVDVELTTTLRAGMHRYTFELEESPQVLLDLEHRDEVISSSLRRISDTEWEGSRISRAWAQEQHVYFVLRFNRPVQEVMMEEEGRLQEYRGEARGTSLKAAFRFEKSDQPLLVKVAISAVDTEGARRNLEAELDHWDFERVKEEGQEVWEKALSKIEIEGGSPEQRTIFYTALYHTMIAPNLYMDIDGRYRGTDLQVHQAEDFTNYTVFSLWDTYRAAHPLFTLIEQERTVDFIQTMLRQYQQGGRLPMWELAGNYTGCMIGYHAVPVIADAWLKGIRGYDEGLAMEAMVHSAMQNRLGIDHYRTNGYIPAELEAESVSKTLEYAYDDWCIARMAEEMGSPILAREFYRRAQFYKNIFDPQTQSMRARLNNGWVAPFDPAEVNHHYTEANAWQYSFYVPQDVDHWMDLLGGRQALKQRLDALFTAPSATTGRSQADITGLIGQYAHGNEPSHHIAYLYNFTGEPWHGQRLARRIMDSLYAAAPNGLSGNEDCGQMSAWLVCSALGFYPVTPGADYYLTGSPWFERALIHLENGNDFVISARDNSPENVYIQSATLNGRPWNKSWLPHDSILAGGEWILQMGPEPGREFGNDPEEIPSQAIEGPWLPAVPSYSESARTFKDSLRLELLSPDTGVIIRYAFQADLSDARVYREPFVIHEDRDIRCWAETAGGEVSKVGRASFRKIPGNRKIRILHPYANHYAAGGSDGLIDRIRGGGDYRAGDWQGYQGVDLEAEIDLGEEMEIRELAVGFLQDENSWIFMPEEVEFLVLEKKNTYRSLGVVQNEVSPREKGVVIRDFSLRLKQPLTARRLKVVARNRGLCPDFHKGAGHQAWIFADEIVIK